MLLVNILLIFHIFHYLISKVYCGSGSVTLLQYSDYLQVQFTVTLATPNINTNFYDYYCISTPTASIIGSTTYELSFSENFNKFWLSDLEIYFNPSSQYMGLDIGGLAAFQLNLLLDLDYSPYPSYSGSSTGTLQDLKGFDQICFSNICGRGRNNCYTYNIYQGYLNLYGVMTSSPIESPESDPTRSPTLSPYHQNNNKYNLAMLLVIIIPVVVVVIIILLKCRGDYYCDCLGVLNVYFQGITNRTTTYVSTDTNSRRDVIPIAEKVSEVRLEKFERVGHGRVSRL